MTTKIGSLEKYLNLQAPIAIAVSGGVDSMTLAVVAHRQCPDTVMFHAVSPAVPHQATARVRHYAEKEGWTLHVIDAGEIHNQDYLENPVNRCYYCKTSLYDSIAAKTGLPIASGTNTDDLGDYRPGLEAAAEHQVIHPWVEADISKQELREIARSLALDDLQELPAAPCLSSRVTTGIPIDPALLPVINEVERMVWQQLENQFELKAVRCRIRPDHIALEIDSGVVVNPASDAGTLLADSTSSIFTEAGYRELCTTVAIEPYRMGSAFLIEAAQID